MELGEVVTLGRHRLLCGDAFNAEHVGALLQGEKPAMLYCDPPYGIGLDTRRSRHRRQPEGAKNRGCRVLARSYSPVIGDQSSFDASALISHFDECMEQFWWGAQIYRASIPAGGSWIAWDKRLTEKFDAVPGNTFELCWSRKRHRAEVIRLRWTGFYGVEQEPERRRLHPTQKPIALAEWFISRYSKEGDIICDLFGGSGSTLLACERLNRRCLMAEISPDYCAVIRERYQRLAAQPSLFEASA